jgi:hypothetical protein
MVQRGEVANRILSVGSNERAILISHYLEPPAPGKPIFKMVSSRGFLTVTGEPASTLCISVRRKAHKGS